MRYEDGIIQDEGIMASWPEHPMESLALTELSDKELVLPRLVRTQELITHGVERTADTIRRHRKTTVALGGTILGSLGFATGAKIFSHRHAH